MNLLTLCQKGCKKMQNLSPFLIQDPVDAELDENFKCPIDLPFKIDVFQQQAAKAIEQEHNALLSCHTGSGKTVPCLFAIHHCLKKNKRVIYTAPVKSLSNQKFKEFSERIPDVGIMTGDIKCNPDAQCVIMTTEILRNMLYTLASPVPSSSASEEATQKQSDKVERTADKNLLLLASDKSAILSTSSDKMQTLSAPQINSHFIAAPIAAADKNLHLLPGATNQPFYGSAHKNLDDVGYVIFDEIHYINDKDRGKNWEEAIVMLPKHIRILGLSGTISEPERFASWIGQIKEIPIHLIRTSRRPIPLNHYLYVDNLNYLPSLTGKNSSNTGKKPNETKEEKEQEQDDEEAAKKSYLGEKAIEKKGLIHIMQENIFLASNYEKGSGLYRNKSLDPVTKKPIKPSPGRPVRYAKSQSPGELNTFLTFLKRERYLPSLIFVLSRRRVEEYAGAVQITLVDYEERAEINKLFNVNMHKFGSSTSSQYETLQQYKQVRDLLLKGIGIHHSGMIPVLKEVVEILFSKGLIKLLFATETFAIGVNMPTKTVVFTELYKPDGRGDTRLLRTDEYLQMSGRAGRRGLDSTGTVIHFPLRELPSQTEMYSLMTGRTPSIQSKFCPGYQFLLKCIVNRKDLSTILNSSLRYKQDREAAYALQQELNKMKAEYDTKMLDFESRVGIETVKKAATWYQLIVSRDTTKTLGNMTIKQKPDKDLQKRIDELGKQIGKAVYNEYSSLMEMQKEISPHTQAQNVEITNLQSVASLNPAFDYLNELGYLEESMNQKEYNPTLKGIVAAEINDCNCILLTEMILQGFFDCLTGPEMIGLLALFIEEKEAAAEEEGSVLASSNNQKKYGTNLSEMIDRVFYMRDDLERLEEERVLSRHLTVDTNWEIFTDFVPIALTWAEGGSVADVYAITNIYEGNFVKNMLRLQNIATSIAEILVTVNKVEQANLLKETASNLVRDIVTNDSLYVRT
jgi:superfamily II RNA helicase